MLKWLFGGSNSDLTSTQDNLPAREPSPPLYEDLQAAELLAVSQIARHLRAFREYFSQVDDEYDTPLRAIEDVSKAINQKLEDTFVALATQNPSVNSASIRLAFVQYMLATLVEHGTIKFAPDITCNFQGDVELPGMEGLSGYRLVTSTTLNIPWPSAQIQKQDEDGSDFFVNLATARPN